MSTKDEFARQVDNATTKYYNQIKAIAVHDPNLKLISKVLAKEAATIEVDAGWSDNRNAQPGLGIRDFNKFLEGYAYATSGALSGQYAAIVKEEKLKTDAEYSEYQRLKAKFEGE